MALRSTSLGLADVIFGAVLTTSAVTSCTPADEPPPVSPSDESESAMTYPEIRAALSAAESRVVDTGVLASQSGASRVLTVGVVVTGGEPISTESLSAMLVRRHADAHARRPRETVSKDSAPHG